MSEPPFSLHTKFRRLAYTALLEKLPYTTHSLHLIPSSLGRPSFRKCIPGPGFTLPQLLPLYLPSLHRLIRTLAQPSISFCHASLPSQPQAAVTNEGSFLRQGMVHPRLLRTYEFVTLHVLCRLPHIAHADLHNRFWPVMLNAGTRMHPAPRIDMPGIQTTPHSSRTWVQAAMQAMLPAWNSPSQFLSPSLHCPARTHTNILTTSRTGPLRPNSVRPRRFLSFTSSLIIPRAF